MHRFIEISRDSEVKLKKDIKEIRGVPCRVVVVLPGALARDYILSDGMKVNQSLN